MILDDFNKTLDEWLVQLQHYNFVSLLIKPDPDSWSIGQVYMHIIAETTWYFGQIRLCFDTLENAEKEMSENGKVMFQKNSFPNIQIKGDPSIAKNIQQPQSVQSLRNGLETLKKEAFALWTIIETTDKQGKSEHPGIQFLSAKEWLQFAEMHMRHHLKQKNRIDNFLKKCN